MKKALKEIIKEKMRNVKKLKKLLNETNKKLIEKPKMIIK